MRSFAHAYPDSEIVKRLVSQLPWGHVIMLLQRVKNPATRHWYMLLRYRRVEGGTVCSVLRRAAQLLPLGGRRSDEARDRPTNDRPASLQEQKQVRRGIRPSTLESTVGVATCETELVEKLPKELEGSLPTIEQIEAELSPKGRKK